MHPPQPPSTHAAPVPRTFPYSQSHQVQASYLPVKIYNFLMAAPLILVVETKPKVVSPNDHGIQLTMVTKTTGLAIAM